MQYHWLNKQNNENLIIFFCGWSFDYMPFENLKCGNTDVLCFYDYGDINSCSPLKGEPKSLISMEGDIKAIDTMSLSFAQKLSQNNPAPAFLTLANAREEQLHRRLEFASRSTDSDFVLTDVDVFAVPLPGLAPLRPSANPPQGVETSSSNSIKNYKNYSLIAWSMGVYVAYLLRDLLPEFSEKIAINGTPYPVHDEWGIPQKTFDLTLKFVDTGLQGKFQKNLFKRPEDYEKYLENPVVRSIANQKQELIELNKYIKAHECTYSGFYDHAIISDTDKIIPTRNQLNFWEGKTAVTVLDNGHFPFFEFESWEDILKCRQTLK